jgi:rare lipoprotein A
MILLIFSLTSYQPSYAGNASWYGPGFHGKKTASGEVFNMNKLTAASNSHPMGTKLKVTNISNNKSVVVKVNDTGGFRKHGRTLDLSKGAFIKIADLKDGLCKVKIETIK